MCVKDGKEKLQARLAVCLLFLCLCLMPVSCGRGDAASADRDAASSVGAETARPAGLDVWFFSCSDDADSILLQTGEANILIDTGLPEDSEALTEKLEGLGVDTLDLLILTHPDKDHIGGAVSVLDCFEVEEVIQTSCRKDSELQDELDRSLEGVDVSVPLTEAELDFGILHLTVYPPRETEYDNANNYSIAVLAEYEGRTFFFAGDAKKKRIGELLAEDLPQVDVYKAAHHGRDGGKSEELIETLQPRIAVVTARSPEEKTREALEEAGAEIRTTLGEDVHMTVTDGVLDVR